MLGDRQRRHLQLDGLVEQLVDATRAIEKRELGVDVKMDELVHASLFSVLGSCSGSVRGSWFALLGSFEPRTERARRRAKRSGEASPKPWRRREHEPSSKNAEV